MAIPTDPSTLLELSACYRCIDEGQRDAVLIYILAVIAGLDGLTPSQLLNNARCYRCIDEGQRQAVMDYLLNQIANGL